MRRVVLAVVTTVTALVFLLSFKTHNPAENSTLRTTVIRTPSGTGSSSPPSSPATPSASSAEPTPADGAAPSSAPSATKRGLATTTTVTGSEAGTRYGPVRVQITVTGGQITAARAVEFPLNSSRDVQINSYAIPQLEQETVSAGNANIDMVSGATYTSEGYLTSLQSAIDKAGL